MKYLESFHLFESQSKKIRKIMDFSIAIKWYRENKQQIADILGVEVDDLAPEEDIVSQSRGLINQVINPQSSGRSGGSIGGFAKFEELDKLIIHDILHNLYEVQEKEFSSDLRKLEFSESEIVEEIECLALEESFMKHMGIRHVKSDFINQNINQLVSFLLPTLIKNDPERIVGILEGRVEPYLEVYGKRYPVANTGFELIFDLLADLPAQPDRGTEVKVKDEATLKTFLETLILVGEVIDQNSGDRAEFPDGDWMGAYDRETLSQHPRYEEFVATAVEENEYVAIREDIWDEFMKRPTYGNVYSYEGENHVFVKEGDVNEEEVDAVELDEDDLERLSDAIGVEWEKPEFIRQLKVCRSLSYYHECEGIDNEIYIAMSESGESAKEYEWEAGKYIGESIPELVERIIDNDDAFALLRRYFRADDVVKNNTSLGKGEHIYPKGSARSWDSMLIRDFKGERNPMSLSKNPLTDNAKKLQVVLDQLRGYMIKQYPAIKDEKRGLRELDGVLSAIRKNEESLSQLIGSMVLEEANITLFGTYSYSKGRGNITTSTKVDNIERTITLYREIHQKVTALSEERRDAFWRDLMQHSFKDLIVDNFKLSFEPYAQQRLEKVAANIAGFRKLKQDFDYSAFDQFYFGLIKATGGDMKVIKDNQKEIVDRVSQYIIDHSFGIVTEVEMNISGYIWRDVDVSDEEMYDTLYDVTGAIYLTFK